MNKRKTKNRKNITEGVLYFGGFVLHSVRVLQANAGLVIYNAHARVYYTKYFFSYFFF